MTKNKNTVLLLITSLASLPLLSSCGSTMRMAVPQGIASKADMVAVKDRSPYLPDSGFTLGEYSVSGADRGWTTSTTEGIGPISKEVTTGSYSYTLSKGALVLKGSCSTGYIEKSVDLGSGWQVGEEQKGLTCSCGDQAKLVISTAEPGANGDKARLSYEADGKSTSPWLSNGETYKGRLFIGDETYEVTALHEADGGINIPEPLGYRITRNNTFAGMVEVLSPGAMWLGKELKPETRELMSCLQTGLMFYRPEQ